MKPRATRSNVERLLKRTLALRNPFSKRFTEGRAFQRLLDDLTREQGARRFEELSPLRRFLTWRLCMLHVRLALDDAVAVDRNPRAPVPTQINTHVAFLNAAVRIAAALGVSARRRAPDLASILAEMAKDGSEGSESAQPEKTAPPRVGAVRARA